MQFCSDNNILYIINKQNKLIWLSKRWIVAVPHSATRDHKSTVLLLLSRDTCRWQQQNKNMNWVKIAYLSYINESNCIKETTIDNVSILRQLNCWDIKWLLRSDCILSSGVAPFVTYSLLEIHRLFLISQGVCVFPLDAVKLVRKHKRAKVSTDERWLELPENRTVQTAESRIFP